MTDIEIIEAIRKATNNTFIGNGCSSTLMGWQQNYDKEGRPLYADPNWRTSYIMIEGKTYGLIRKGWWAWVIKPEYKDKIHYTHVMFNNGENLKDCLIMNNKIDLRPDYVKEYHEQLKRENGKR